MRILPARTTLRISFFSMCWAWRPYKDGGNGLRASLEPRALFKVWSKTVAAPCRVWTEEQLETAGMLAFVYGKARRVEPSCPCTALTDCIIVHRDLAWARAREGEIRMSSFRTQARRCVVHVRPSVNTYADGRNRLPNSAYSVEPHHQVPHPPQLLFPVAFSSDKVLWCYASSLELALTHLTH
jgi:hypothetical protein